MVAEEKKLKESDITGLKFFDKLGPLLQLTWGQGVDVDQIERHHIRDFLDWVHDKATNDGGSNAGRTANKARENLRAIMSWAWEQDYVEKLPRFPKPKPQRDVAGRHYLTKSDLNALYFATYQLPRPRGWNQPFTVGHYWRAALVVFFNYGVDTGKKKGTFYFEEEKGDILLLLTGAVPAG